MPAPSLAATGDLRSATATAARLGALALACALVSAGAQPAAGPGAAVPARPTLPAGALQPGEAARELGATAPNDTLWQIARRVQAPGLTPHQVMVALARRNPQAFVGGNMYWLRVGVPLVLPSRAELQAEPAAPSAELVATHRRAWQSGRAQAPDWATLPRPPVLPGVPAPAPAPAAPAVSAPPTAPPAAAVPPGRHASVAVAAPMQATAQPPAPAPAPASSPAAGPAPVTTPVPAVNLPVLPPPATPDRATAAPVAAPSAPLADEAGASAPPAPVPMPEAAVLPPRGLDPAWLLAPFALLLAAGGLLWWWRLGRGDGFARTEPAAPPSSASAAARATAAARAAGASAVTGAAPVPAPAVRAAPTVAATPGAPGRPTTAAVWHAPAGAAPAPPAVRPDGESELELLVAKAYLELGQPAAAREWLDALAAHAPTPVRDEAARLLRWHGA